MSLPQNPNTPIIPANWQNVYSLLEEHDAWYSGDPNRLANVFANRIYTPSEQGKFWARDVYKKRSTTLHVPIAGDISSTSSAMLFSEHPKIKTDTNSQERLDEIISQNGLYATLLEAAEIASALGGVYLKLNWNKDLADYPIINIAQPDSAYFDTEFGIITGITFFKTVLEDDKYTYRLLEHHTSGRIENALYRSIDCDEIGDRIALNYISETAGIPDYVETQLPGLAAKYIPNMKPNRRFRGLPIGQSDYSGSESLMDSLDETMTSLLLDIKLGKGKIIAPETFFQLRNGKMSFDLDTEAYLSLNVPLGDSGSKNEITLNQFEIRTEEHIDSATALMRQIFNNAGYSPQTFGLDINGSAESGTALSMRERKSFVTSAKKAEYWQPAIKQILEFALIVDKVHLGSNISPADIQVEMQDSIKGDITQVADSVQKLSVAGALSTYTMIQMVHPDWEDEQVNQEMDRILEEKGLSVPDVMQSGVV